METEEEAKNSERGNYRYYWEVLKNSDSFYVQKGKAHE